MQQNIKEINRLINLMFSKGYLVNIKEWMKFANVKTEKEIFDYDIPKNREDNIKHLRENLLKLFNEEELIFKFEEEILKNV